MDKRKRYNQDRPPRNFKNQPRRPPHLKGREIGMFYARRHMAKSKKDFQRPLGAIYLSPSKRDIIQNILDSTAYKNIFVIDNGSYDHVQDSSFKRNFLRVIRESIDEKLQKVPIVLPEDPHLDDMYYEEYLSKFQDHAFLRMVEKRKKLPTYEMKEQILKVIEENQVVVISGETGCGKTTQVPQYILDDALEKNQCSECKIMCTQPRRISAISVAQRVAEERVEDLGKSVGYQIRMEKRMPRDRASITFCTTGVVLKMMESDPSLCQISHLILDEIHERDVVSDFILALIKKIKTLRTDLKIVLMSATLNSAQFSKYYDDAPHLNIPGFTYPVQEYYLEDVLQRTGYVFKEKRLKQAQIEEYNRFIGAHVRLLEATKTYDRHVLTQLRNPLCEEVDVGLIFELLVDICQNEKDEGAILVFVTGFVEISSLIKKVTESSHFPAHQYLVFPLHSMMPTIEQKQIFEAPPRGVRKIIIATNIAETSITIEDVVYVIDCGKIKMTNFDVATNSDILAPRWVSIANANQRRGRAGRVKPGICFHLFSQARLMVLDQYQLPEILRSRLEGVILTAKVLQLGQVEPFFSELIDSPDPMAVVLALDLLKNLNALTDDEKLTPLGYHLAKLPMAPQMGKMILFGAIFSCLDPILSVAATLDYKEPFQLPLGKEKEVTTMKQELAGLTKSDHWLFHMALKGFEESGNGNRRFCWKYFLSYHTMVQLQNMKKQFMEYLHEMNFVPDSNPKTLECNRNSDNLSLIKAIICAGLYPNIVISRHQGKMPNMTPQMQKVKIHPKSVLAECKYFDTNMMVYYRKIHSNSDYIHDASLIHPLPVIFFGDKFERSMHEGRNIISVKNLNFLCSENTSLIIGELRDRFEWFLEYKISHPGPVIWGKEDETKVLNVIMELITCEDMEVFDDDTFDDQV